MNAVVSKSNLAASTLADPRWARVVARDTPERPAISGRPYFFAPSYPPAAV